MQNSLKAIVACVGVFLASTASAYPVYDYASLQQALAAGRNVAVSLDLSQCAPVGSAPPSQTKGGLTSIGAYRIVSDGTLSFSDQRFTVSTTTAEPLQQLLRYQVRPDNVVTFTTFIFSLPTYALTSQVGYTCAINRGIKLFAE